MKLYELTCLISPELSLEELNSFQKQIISFIQEEEGILGRINKITKKNLAYPIKKKDEANLLILDFHIDPENLKNLEKKIKNQYQILRYLFSIKKAEKPVLKIKEPWEFPKKVFAKATKPKVELEKIDEKLEEILKE